MLRKVNALVTGPPRCGKSTLITNLSKRLRVRGFKVGGITTPEIRSPTGTRTGFLIRDIDSGKEQTMASVGLSSDIQVGRYGVNVDSIRTTGVEAIKRAVTAFDIVVIDEIGKMEVVVPEFQQWVSRALDSEKTVLGTISRHFSHPFFAAIKHRPDVIILQLTRDNQAKICKRLNKLLKIE